ncbi:MAG: hypothetical protein HY700_14585 [Gemmatimonadetes bacterium]|nr:hypothetical protein [Gemmatimonadota bacterium]
MGKTGIASRMGIVLCTAAVAASAPAVAQTHQLGVIGLGAFSRVGAVPQAFQPGIPVAIEASVQWPLIGSIELATSADLTVQKIGTLTSVASPTRGVSVVRRPYSFNVVHFGFGLGFTREPSSRIRVSGSAQGMMLVPSWSSASVGTCGESCTLLIPSSANQQTELHFGAAARLRVTYGRQGNRIGLELLGIAGPRHSSSRLPLSTIAMLLVVGGT